ARREDALQQVAEAIAADGGQATVHPIDVSDPEATVDAIAAIDADVGGLDLVVANAGVAQGKWSGKLTWDDCRSTIDVNVTGATATLVAALPAMVQRKRGHLVGISSIASYRGLPKFAAYSASKAYLSHFLEGLRVDLRSTGVAVTDIRPGYVRTPMNEGTGSLPFSVTAEDAAQRIWKAIAGRRAVLTFPLPMATAAHTMSAVPNVLYDRIVGRR
ncbi:MAG: SDR family NAD(P)-dependent oxidoreductase, partial [Nannocystaceae bacterium]